MSYGMRFGDVVTFDDLRLYNNIAVSPGTRTLRVKGFGALWADDGWWYRRSGDVWRFKRA